MNTAKLPRVSFTKSQPHLFPQRLTAPKEELHGLYFLLASATIPMQIFCLVAVCPILNLLILKLSIMS